MEPTEAEFDAAVAKRVAELEGCTTDFEGANCFDECAGWDGVSHRCECGNRRVYWDYSGRGKDGTVHVMAVAY